MAPLLLLSLLALLGCAAPASGRIEVMLRTSGWRWVRDQDADFQVQVPLPNGRRQRVVIRQKVFATERGQMREILSKAEQLNKAPESGLLRHLLEASAEIEVWGHWGLIKNPASGEYIIAYIIKIPENSGQSLLRRAVLEAAHVADHWERLTSGLDQY